MGASITPAEARLVEQIEQAEPNKGFLAIKGHGSKAFLGRPVGGVELSTLELNEVIAYEPSELIVTVQAGVSLVELETLLASKGQCLASDPPQFGVEGVVRQGTVGGMIASGLAGPARPWAGGVRDAVLGLHLINGAGRYLRFGGQVMKNVAGYDVSRLMVGAMGCLGLISQVSLKVLPLPQGTKYFQWDCSLPELLSRYGRWQRNMNPISGLAHDGRQAYLRLAGGGPSIAQFASDNGLTEVVDQGVFWQGLRDHTLPFFEGDMPVWRMSVPPLTDLSRALEQLSAPYVMDWAGAQYWVLSSESAPLDALARQHGGSVQSYSGALASSLSFIDQPLLALHQRLKAAYDPQGILNKGRMHESF